MKGKQTQNKTKDKFCYMALFILLVIIVSLSCNVPLKTFNANVVNDNQKATSLIQSAIVESLTAEAAEVDSVSEGGDESSGMSEAAQISATPSLTPSITPSPTLTSSPTSDQAVVFISENTNCRYGPGSVYDLIEIFMAGASADLVGKNQEETFWFIQDQEGGFIKCWLWGKYATPEGNTENLPVFTPPPTPTPVIDFTIAYKETFCGGKEIIVKITNTGDLTLESYSITLKDKTTSEVTNKTANSFDGGTVKVPIGKSGDITGKIFSASTIGHKIVATIKICSDDNLSGLCTTRTAEFKSK